MCFEFKSTNCVKYLMISLMSIIYLKWNNFSFAILRETKCILSNRKVDQACLVISSTVPMVIVLFSRVFLCFKIQQKYKIERNVQSQQNICPRSDVVYGEQWSWPFDYLLCLILQNVEREVWRRYIRAIKVESAANQTHLNIVLYVLHIGH